MKGKTDVDTMAILGEELPKTHTKATKGNILRQGAKIQVPSRTWLLRPRK